MTAACHPHNRSTNSQGPGTLGLVLALRPNLALAFALAVKVMTLALALCHMALLTSLLIAIDSVLGFGKGVRRGPGDRRTPVRFGGKSLVEVWRKKTPKPAIFSKLY